jgi:hypothetical protein
MHKIVEGRDWRRNVLWHVKQKKLMLNFNFILFKLRVEINQKNIQNTTPSMLQIF